MNIYLSKKLKKKRFEVSSKRMCVNKKPELFRNVIPQSRTSYIKNIPSCGFKLILTWNNFQ